MDDIGRPFQFVFFRPVATCTDLQLIIDVHFVLYYISMYVSLTEEGPAPVRQSGRGLDEDRPLPQPSRAPKDLRTPERGGQQQVPVHQIPLH